MATDPTPMLLLATAGYLLDTCDGPEGGAAACERAAAIVQAVGDRGNQINELSHARIKAECQADLAAREADAAIVAAVRDPMFLESLHVHVHTLRSSLPTMGFADLAARFRLRAEAIERVLAAVGLEPPRWAVTDRSDMMDDGE